MILWNEHITLPAMRRETHFDGREMWCFAERPTSFYGLFAHAVSVAPADEALASNDERWTYQQADQEVNRIASGLAKLGIQAGDRVVMFIANKAEFIFVLYALQKIELLVKFTYSKNSLFSKYALLIRSTIKIILF
jgi:O-succinylbenzoic acid--CoA ligase